MYTNTVNTGRSRTTKYRREKERRERDAGKRKRGCCDYHNSSPNHSPSALQDRNQWRSACSRECYIPNEESEGHNHEHTSVGDAHTGNNNSEQETVSNEPQLLKGDFSESASTKEESEGEAHSSNSSDKGHEHESAGDAAPEISNCEGEEAEEEPSFCGGDDAPSRASQSAGEITLSSRSSENHEMGVLSNAFTETSNNEWEEAEEEHSSCGGDGDAPSRAEQNAGGITLSCTNSEEQDDASPFRGDSDPEDPSTSEDEGSGDSSDPDQTNFSLDHAELNVICRSIRNSSVKEALAMMLAIAVRDCLTYESLIRIMNVLNAVLGRKYLPSNKKALWRVLNRNSAGIEKHAYCSCQRGLGLVESLPEIIQCECGLIIQKKKVKYFIVLSLRSQFEKMLSRPEIRNLLEYRRNRQKRDPDAMEDILDGASYKHLQQEGRALSSPTNFSYTFNTDGFQLANSSKTRVWPILVKWNELPLNVRQKYMFLGGLWLDKVDPPMNLFLAPFVRQANALSSRGVPWKVDDSNVTHSLFVPTCCVLDSKAHCVVLNMQPPTGYYGCTFCVHPGVQAAGVKFPVVNVPQPERRTDASIKNDMRNTVMNRDEHLRGVKGPSVLMNMNHFDLGSGFTTDDLHPIFIGTAEFHTHLLLNMQPAEKVYIDGQGGPKNRLLIHNRLIVIKTPTCISRKPRGMDEINQWNGTEWRNWLLYYAVPCLVVYLVHTPRLLCMYALLYVYTPRSLC